MSNSHSVASHWSDIETGTTLFQAGCRSAAVKLFRRALQPEPGNALAHYLLGLALQRMGDAELARDQWNAACHCPETGDDAVWARHQAGIILERLAAERA